MVLSKVKKTFKVKYAIGYNDVAKMNGILNVIAPENAGDIHIINCAKSILLDRHGRCETYMIKNGDYNVERKDDEQIQAS